MLHRSIYDQDNIKAARGTIHDCLRAVSQDVGFIRALHKAGQRQDITPEYADMLEEILAATRKFVDNWEPKSG